MAIVKWVGRAQAVAKYMTVVVGSATVGQARSITYDGITASYTVVTGDTVATVAAAVVAVAQALVAGQWKELTVAQNSTTPAQIDILGPSDGAPVTLTVSSGMTLATVTAETGPNDAAATANYSTGSLPGANDVLVFDRGAAFEGPKYNLTAIAALADGGLIVYPTYGGVIGLPPVNAVNGYYEWRPRFLSVKATAIRIAQSSSNNANQFNILCVNVAATAIIVEGTNISIDDVLEVYGQVSTSSIVNSGGSVTVAKSIGQTAVVPTINSTGGRMNLGIGCTLTNLILDTSAVRISASYATLKMDRNSNVIVDGVAACTTASPALGTTVDEGTFSWQSSGALPVITVGSGGTLDTSLSPGVAITTLNLQAGATLNDPADRITKPFNIALVNCRPDEVTMTMGTGRTLTVA